MSENNKYRVVSLFTGAMGLDIGLEETGKFNTIACVEKVPVFCETIRRNRDMGNLTHSDLIVFEKDIQQLDPVEVLDTCNLEPMELDVLSGGPPCQTFSTAGRRRTIQDTRGLLIWDFLKFIDVIKPKFFLMENVRGLLSAAINHRPIKDRPEMGGSPLDDDEQPGSVVNLFLNDIAKIGYRTDVFEVNAVNYGAPQLRERVLFIGNRYNTVVDFPQPTHGPVTQNDDKFKQESLVPVKELLPFRTLGDAIKGIEEENPVIIDFSPRKKRYLTMVPSGGNWRSLPVDVQKESMGRAWHAKGGRSGWWRRLTYDLPCPTILTLPNHSGTSLCHPEEVRALTVRECALIQEFPTKWEFLGTPQEQYAQVGNAVPVTLGRVAGRVIASELDKIIAGNNEPSKEKTEPFRRVYIKSHIRTRKWYKSGEVYVWKDGEDNSRVDYNGS